MIEGKVAAIINSRELAINRGSKDGVEDGMRFEVLDTTAGEITDPDTNERLGTVEGVKVRVEAVDVYERFTVAQTYELTGGNNSLASMLKWEASRPRP